MGLAKRLYLGEGELICTNEVLVGPPNHFERVALLLEFDLPEVGVGCGGEFRIVP